MTLQVQAADETGSHVVHHLRIHPVLRNDLLERSDCKDIHTLYFALGGDFDLTVDPVRSVSSYRLGTVLREVTGPHATILEIPEPLWVRYWPRLVYMLLLVRLHRATKRTKAPLVVVAYAIENAAFEERATLPALDSFNLLQRVWLSLVKPAWALSLHLVDALVYGTPASEANYRRTFGRAVHSMDTMVIPDSLPTCAACKDVPRDARPLQVAFVGELSDRKGVADLVDAWLLAERTGCLPKGARLAIAGDGPLYNQLCGASVTSESIALLGLLDRTSVHCLLSSAQTVVLPSKRVPRWREQIGVSLLEGEAHGCLLVASSESGLAREFAARSGAIVVPPNSTADLVRALTASFRTKPRVRRGSTDGRAAVEEYLHSLIDEDLRRGRRRAREIHAHRKSL